MGPVLPLLAQQVPTTDVTAWLIGTPVTVLAAGLVAIMRGWLVPGPSHKRVLDENDELKAERRRDQELYVQTVIPTLTRITDFLLREERERRP